MTFKRIIPFLLTVCWLNASADAPKGFSDFRQDMLNRYQSFRSEVLENYAKFLDGEWVDIKIEKALPSNPVPKPPTIPVLKKNEPTLPPVVIPDVSLPTSPLPETPKEGNKETPDFIKGIEGNTQKPPVTSLADIDFYGIRFSVPSPGINIMKRITDQADFGHQWRELDKQHAAISILPHLNNLADSCNLNDYLTAQLIMKYVGGLFNEAESSSRMSLSHYLLAHMGYNVRLATTSSGKTMLLIPFKEEVYGRAFLEMDGLRFYIFTEADEPPQLNGESIRTCKIPESVNAGKALSLQIPESLNLPYKPVDFDFSYGGLSIKGQLNANLFPIVHRYPQMPIAGYAASELQKDVRESVLEQLREQTKGMTKNEAVEKLLHFVQSAFSYATDTDFHGFEKPYFVEETLFYPKCDCEDRAVLYTWLLWNVLGVESHIIYYPGHESAAVKIDREADGDGYVFNGSHFYISDPTYIGAGTGRCMPSYRTVKPTIDFEYKQ